MTSKIVKGNFFGESNAPLQFLGSSNLYDLRWNPTNGDIELVQTGPVLDGSPIILFSNDTWDQTHVANATAGSGPIDYIPDSLAIVESRKAYSLQIADLILQAQKSNGGGVIPPWIKEINLVEKDEDKNLIVDKLIAKTLTNKIKIGDVDSNLQDALSHTNFKKTDVTLNTIKELMLDGPLKYPIDAIYSNRKTGYNQDHVRITQYSYQPPRAQIVQGRGRDIVKEKDELKATASSGSGSAYDIFSKGVQRQSPLKNFLGMVRLPMPTDISDSNNVAWGQDQVNNLSAAMTSAIGGDLLGAAALGVTGAGVGGFLFGDAEGGASLGVTLAALGNAGIDLKDLPKGQSGALARSTLQSRL